MGDVLVIWQCQAIALANVDLSSEGIGNTQDINP